MILFNVAMNNSVARINNSAGIGNVEFRVYFQNSMHSLAQDFYIPFNSPPCFQVFLEFNIIAGIRKEIENFINGDQHVMQP